MTRNELKFLFNTHLKRDYTPNEWIVHGKKNYHLFEHEILNCSEYFLINKKDVKIALLLSGHIRKNSIYNNISSALNRYDTDIFIHTWDNFGLKGTETNVNDHTNESEIEKEIQKFNNVKSFIIENNKQLINGMEKRSGYFNFSSPEPFIKSQLYSINKSYELMNNYSKENNINYDIVFKFRFDCDIFYFNLKKHTINNIKNNNIIFTSNNDCNHSHMDYGTSCWACDNMYYKYGLKHVHIFEHTNVICDLFAYGNQKSMESYCNLYNVYDELISEFEEENKKQLEKHSSNLKLINGDYKLEGMRGHIDSLYYYNCSYPERLLQKYLKDYMLVESRDVKLKLVR